MIATQLVNKTVKVHQQVHKDLSIVSILCHFRHTKQTILRKVRADTVLKLQKQFYYVDVKYERGRHGSKKGTEASEMKLSWSIEGYVL